MGCGQQIRKGMRYHYRQVLYVDPEKKPKTQEWADEYLHAPCRWVVYALWDGETEEPSLAPWLPPLLRLVGKDRIFQLGGVTRKTYMARGEDEEIPAWKDIGADGQQHLLKWIRGQKPSKPTRIRRVYVNKTNFPFEADPPWTAQEWLQLYAPHILGDSDERRDQHDGSESAKGDPVDGSGRTELGEGRGGSEQEQEVATS